MVRRNLFRFLITGGIMAAIGYLMRPRQSQARRWFSLNINQLPLSRKDMRRAGSMLYRSLRTALAR